MSDMKDLKPCKLVLDCGKASEACSYLLLDHPRCFKGKPEATQKQDPLGSAEFALLSDNCACCGKVIEVNHVRLGAGEHSICMGCEGAEIDVWKVECNGSWYVEKNFANVAEILEDIEHDEPYTISKLKMMFAQYISLPEFQGF